MEGKLLLEIDMAGFLFRVTYSPSILLKFKIFTPFPKTIRTAADLTA